MVFLTEKNLELVERSRRFELGDGGDRWWIGYGSVLDDEGKIEAGNTKDTDLISKTESVLDKSFDSTDDEKQGKVTLYLVISVVYAIFSRITTGYNAGVMNAPEAVVFPSHTVAQWSLAVSIRAVAGPIGSLAAGPIADVFGRSGALLLNTWLLLIGSALMAFAPNIHVLIFARFLTGFADGASNVIVPIYLGEIAPRRLRGPLGTFTQLSFCIGILLSALLAFPLATKSGWRLMFSVTPIFCVLQLMLSPLVLESPRWLLMKDEESEEAKENIQLLRGLSTETLVDNEIQDLICALTTHLPLTRYNTGTDTEVGSIVGDRPSCSKRHVQPKAEYLFWPLLQSKMLRTRVICAVLLHFTQQAAGIGAVFFYSTTFFSNIIDEPLQGTAWMALINLLSTCIALYLMDKVDYRSLLMSSGIGMLLSTALITVASVLDFPGSTCLTVIGVMGFVAFFEIGLGPIPFLIIPELFDTKFVSTAMSLSCAVNFASAFLVQFLFPFAIVYLGSWSFSPFILVELLLIGYLILLPKGSFNVL